MDKHALKNQVLENLKEQLAIAIASANTAHSTATHSESVAENKYDTFGLEASYLAHGQSERIDQLNVSIQKLETLSLKKCAKDAPVSMGSLITLNDSDGNHELIFMLPSAGGVKVAINDQTIVVVTPEAPLGAV